MLEVHIFNNIFLTNVHESFVITFKFSVLFVFLADQLLFAPAFIGALISSIGLLQGQKPDDVKKKLARDFPEILMSKFAGLKLKLLKSIFTFSKLQNMARCTAHELLLHSSQLSSGFGANCGRGMEHLYQFQNQYTSN